MRHRMVALWASQCLCHGEGRRRWRHSTRTTYTTPTPAATTPATSAAAATQPAASPRAMWSSSAGPATAARATGCGSTATARPHRRATTVPSRAAWQPYSSATMKTTATSSRQCEALLTNATDAIERLICRWRHRRGSRMMLVLQICFL